MRMWSIFNWYFSPELEIMVMEEKLSQTDLLQ